MPATAVPASTVMLLRDAPESPEVLLLERHARSEFLPDIYVFPGGRVDEPDRALARHVGGLSESAARQALPQVDPDLALAFFVAAIRETFEEAGILLARRRGETELIGAHETRALCRHRLDVQEGKTRFLELVEAEKLELAAEQLCVHAHWITPEFMPRRFDTLFFAAAAPLGQLAHHDGIESSAHTWIRPEDALKQASLGERQMIFPTRCNLETLAGFESVEQALVASRERPVVPVLPRLDEREGQRRLVIPLNAGYLTTEELVGRSPA